VELVGDALRARAVFVEHGHRRAELGEAPAGGAADACAGTTGDDDDASGEFVCSCHEVLARFAAGPAISPRRR
jgi:hypothetical protein